MTRELAASGHIPALAVSAGQHVLAAGGMSARNVAGLVFLGLVLAAVYLIRCRIWPYGPCLSCRGRRGHSWGSTSTRHGRCKVCRGSGERLRIGTRLLRSWTGGRWPR